jgi:hypothetical protein
LHLAVKALIESSAAPRLTLLCAGGVAPDPETAHLLEQLKKRGQAKVVERYVSDSEQSLCFCASDVSFYISIWLEYVLSLSLRQAMVIAPG